MDLLSVISKKRKFGFTMQSGEATWMLNSTFDCHRAVKAAEVMLVGFSNDIPKDYVQRAIIWLKLIGAPVDDGSQYAVTSSTIQSDSNYIRASLLVGHPIKRLVYSMEGSVRKVNAWMGNSKFSTSLMGPLSNFKYVMGMNDKQWKETTRTRALLTYLHRQRIPYTDFYSSIQVSGVTVNVSGHVLNYLLFTAFLGTPLSRGFDLGEFRDGYITNMTSAITSSEPSFSDPAWHSWLETEVAVFSAFFMIRSMSHAGVVMQKSSVKLALMAGVDILRHNARNSRTSITKLRTGLRLYDPKFYTSPSDIKIRFVVMPMGSGKSTLSAKFPAYIVDIDDVTKTISKKHVSMVNKAFSTNEWPVYNSWYYKKCCNHIDYRVKDGHKIFLIHNPELANLYYPHAPLICLVLPKHTCVERIIKRDGGSNFKLASLNWESVSTTTKARVVRVPNNDVLESILFSWAAGNPIPNDIETR